MPKVMVELDYEQIDAIIIQELEEQIRMVYRKNKYIHQEDEAADKELGPALLIVYEYFAGTAAAKKLKDEICDAARLS